MDSFDFDGIAYGDDGLTNFRPAERPIYEEAMRRYTAETGDTRLYIGGAIEVYGRANPHMLALRCMDRTGDLSRFWAIFDAVEEEMEPSRPTPWNERKASQ